MSGLEPLFLSAAGETIGGAALGTGLTVPAATALPAAVGETLLGGALAPAVEGMGLGTGLQAVASASPILEAPIAASMISPAAQAAGITLGSGLIPPATIGAAPAGLTGMQALNLAKSGLQLTSQGGQRTAYSPPKLNRGRKVTLAAPVQSLLEAQPMRRRKDMLSLI